MALNASIFRQFEFVQQQWIEYGNDSHLGNDKDPLTGNHDGTGKFMVQGTTELANPPFVCGGLPKFVELRGGDYFFIPSLTALAMIAFAATSILCRLALGQQLIEFLALLQPRPKLCGLGAQRIVRQGLQRGLVRGRVANQTGVVFDEPIVAAPEYAGQRL